VGCKTWDQFAFCWLIIQEEDCCEYVAMCRICQVKQPKSKDDHVPINHIPWCDRVFDHMFIDCVGLFVSGDGTKQSSIMRWSLLIVTIFSHFVCC